MAGKEITQSEGQLVPPSPARLVVAIAVDGRRKSKYVVRWALDKFVPQGEVLFKLLHVRPRITAVPTPMGNSIPLSQVREDVVAAYKKEIEWQTNEMLLPYKKMCSQRKVQVEVMLIESDDVENAIAEEVNKSAISKLVIGAASRGIFTRKVKKHNLSSRISACTPSFCTVFAVSKGKLSSIRPSDLESNASIKDDSSETSDSAKSSTSYTSSSRGDTSSVSSLSHFHSPSLPMQRFHALSTINQSLLNTAKLSAQTNHSRCQSLQIEEGDETDNGSEVKSNMRRTSSVQSLITDAQSWISDQASTSDMLTDYPSLESQANLNFELEKLRIELRHARGMYAMAQSETMDASRKINNLKERQLEEAMKLKDVKFKEQRAAELARQEQEKYHAAKTEATCVKDRAEREASQRKEAEMKALHDAKEKENLENALLGQALQYQMFSWEEIVSATSSFSESLKIGMGAYGTVYKCSMHHTNVAVKVLHAKESQKSKQFQQELEILSKARHPHLLLLIGACPDHGCLIYEYLENGSLEERLLRKNNTPPIPWFARFRIAWEVASALVFLHNSKPKPIIHRDLKPANILLDHNYVSKIGDVGLSTMLNDDPTIPTKDNDTGPVGTLSYMDPEYQRTGEISPKSDVYAFGMVILQLLTAKPAVALTHTVERAIEEGSLVKILDEEAGNWPLEETRELAMLGLSCAELRRRDRPDLKDKVLPKLEKLKEIADEARDAASNVKILPPSHFVCPILKDVMADPYVAADGYTYDRTAIEKWLEENDKSPMTNLPLPHKNLIPNYTLLSAIMEWKSRVPLSADESRWHNT
ncbi:hypothetical protein BT93_A2368 [Corymbia citriodora subsp. variegata]|nr:hypothetical protein BT93_A2368 [Corymbia citriodora subsp. variegata]KAF8044353.1 hypothetical protein BT93_A2368 [Corymbia citriodora subsp. variegata]